MSADEVGLPLPTSDQVVVRGEILTVGDLVKALEETFAPEVRVAMVLREDADWCSGVTVDSDPRGWVCTLRSHMTMPPKGLA